MRRQQFWYVVCTNNEAAMLCSAFTSEGSALTRALAGHSLQGPRVGSVAVSGMGTSPSARKLLPASTSIQARNSVRLCVGFPLWIGSL